VKFFFIVKCVLQAPLYDLWDNIVVGMKVEVENTDYETFSEGIPASFWVATVLRIAGKIQERFFFIMKL
jgi:hypothetical protein